MDYQLNDSTDYDSLFIKNHNNLTEQYNTISSKINNIDNYILIVYHVVFWITVFSSTILYNSNSLPINILASFLLSSLGSMFMLLIFPLLSMFNQHLFLKNLIIQKDSILGEMSEVEQLFSKQENHSIKHNHINSNLIKLL